MYKNAVSSFWVVDEIDLSKDYTDFVSLNQNEKHFISMILAFFNQADGLINENLASRFLNEIQVAEIRLFYGFQIAMEGIHSETYSNLIDCYIKDKNEQDKLFNAINNFECIKLKADWCKKYINSNDNFTTRLVAFACVEGIFFSGAFCSIFWFKKQNKLKGLCFSNELISRDEGLHTEFAVEVYKLLTNKLSQNELHLIIQEAVEIETNFICEALPCRLIGMNSGLMTQYIQFVADRLAVQLGATKIYEVSNPFDWMELISMERKTNFFESRVSEYALASKQVIDVNVFDDINAYSF
jgi:ribonucleoside-diphosphate reductase subunit M2